MTSRTILVVANRTASTPALLEVVSRRAEPGSCFTLLIPPEVAEHADWTQEDALGLLRRAARGCSVETVDCGPDAVATIHRILSDRACDEIIVSTHSSHHERWLHHDLPHRLQKEGVPVIAIPPEPSQWGPIEGFPSEWVHPEVPTPTQI